MLSREVLTVWLIFCHGSCVQQPFSYEHVDSLFAQSIRAIGPSKASIIEAMEIEEGELVKP